MSYAEGVQRTKGGVWSASTAVCDEGILPRGFHSWGSCTNLATPADTSERVQERRAASKSENTN